MWATETASVPVVTRPTCSSMTLPPGTGMRVGVVISRGTRSRYLPAQRGCDGRMPRCSPAARQAEAQPVLGARENRWDDGGRPAILAAVEEVEVVVAHQERATLRVGGVFLKIDADQARTDVEVEAMAIAPIPTPQVLWRKPPVLALAALPGTALGRLGEPSTASSAAWVAAGAAVRRLHDAPLPRWPGRTVEGLGAYLAHECEWLVANDVLPADVVARNRRIAETALRPWTPGFVH